MSRIMRRTNRTKQHSMRKSPMKQTINARNCTARAVGRIIGNDEAKGSIPFRGTRFHCIFRITQTRRSQHYAALRGTNHDFEEKEGRWTKLAF